MRNPHAETIVRPDGNPRNNADSGWRSRVLLLIDYQSRMAFAAKSIDAVNLRTTMNSRITDWISEIGKSRIVLGGLWTSVCADA